MGTKQTTTPHVTPRGHMRGLNRNFEIRVGFGKIRSDPKSTDFDAPRIREPPSGHGSRMTWTCRNPVGPRDVARGYCECGDNGKTQSRPGRGPWGSTRGSGWGQIWTRNRIRDPKRTSMMMNRCNDMVCMSNYDAQRWPHGEQTQSVQHVQKGQGRRQGHGTHVPPECV